VPPYPRRMPARIGTLLSEFRTEVARERLRRTLQSQAPGIRIDRSVEVRSPERLNLARDVMVDSGVLIHCGGMEWSGGSGGISIGERSYVGPNTVLFGAGGIEIGELVLISPGVVITSHQHTFERRKEPIREQPMQFEKVTVERDVWIGANATVLPGVTLGQGCVVGAAATVTRDVPPGAVVLGTPARIARER